MEPTRLGASRRVLRAFREHYGSEAECLATAPGRVNLVGGHTDYSEGFVLPAAIDRRTAVAGRTREDDVISVYAHDDGESVSTRLAEITPLDGPSWANYVLGVVAEVRASAESRQYGIDRGLDLCVAGDVPRGAGLSSSAALELAVGAVVAHGSGADLPAEELARAAWRAETGFVGVDCGIMDQYAAALGRAGFAFLLDCRTRGREYVPVDSGRVRLVVVDTNVEHELVASAYNDRVAECREAVERLDALLDREIRALRDVDRETFEAHGDALSDRLARRVRHVVSENERARAAASALAAGDVDGVGDLMDASHASLRDDYEVSCTELDCVVDIARETTGVLGARMTGGGFGGSVVALVRVGAVDAFGARVQREYPTRTGIEADVYECETADGVRIERVEDLSE